MSVRYRNRVKGALFEILVKLLLMKSGYNIIPSDGKFVKEGKLRGRGGWHQIDAFGYYSYGIPCLYPVRIICEAKNYDGKVGLPTIRNFVGAFKDIAENYFVERLGASADYLLTKRYTDAGSVFSAHGFTTEAQDYAYAQGVFLVSYEDNPVLSPLLRLLEPLLGLLNLEIAAKRTYDFREWISKKLENPRQTLPEDAMFSRENSAQIIANLSDMISAVRTSCLGTASGVYPIHLLSRNKIPWHLFEDSDETYCRIYYYEGSENCLEIVPSEATDFRFYISVPKEIVAKYRDRMLEFKQRFFEYVDFPVQRDRVRRILRFKLDTQWINSLRARKRNRRQ